MNTKDFKNMSIKLTDFSLRHFEEDFAGTKVLTMTPTEYEEALNKETPIQILDGYADFCKILVFDNTTTVRCGSMPIDMCNTQYMKSGYSARTDEELPVLSRWFELPYGIEPPYAKYMNVIIYSKEQMEKEDKKPFDADWGIVSIQGTMEMGPDPIPPITMMRNALGIEHGGSGVEIDIEEYKRSVEFWNNNLIIKSVE
jgi:hypothetical protein